MTNYLNLFTIRRWFFTLTIGPVADAARAVCARAKRHKSEWGPLDFADRIQLVRRALRKWAKH